MTVHIVIRLSARQVIGQVGDSLSYDEQVVYRDDAVKPAYLVIYEPEVEDKD